MMYVWGTCSPTETIKVGLTQVSMAKSRAWARARGLGLTHNLATRARAPFYYATCDDCYYYHLGTIGLAYLGDPSEYTRLLTTWWY